ncbi:MAG: hypothetical protein A2X19_08905 [Bacteroidetes bacterium GWE2_39_28]|nr:MAG: hypothetical protein A2X19_08905 [Bacteroidetes bacterium GWE2_39_28]OFY12171.1 MAG: hypothetical protein A2X16_06390 [Bacteroidetes bacterium GWF2_39_10]OFZ06817.1 MAG: hypothetical protein A2322_03855 [Bacteroidetes bacterium RIFOXYB2_FULL_39_7]OFZ12350.1 MAG: hypothetical protein A2465_10890 [Bacteroidetes bacterium RIFOXYC2_FULL_39_11]HCT94201.1 hypothetical protein [Rikenellaceae bacterium]
MDKEKVKTIISRLECEFDSHEFIEKYLSTYEKDYVELLYSFKDSKKGIFRAAHSKIGKYLSSNSSSLKIEKIERGNSENIKKYDSENQTWKKIIKRL